MEEKKCCDCFWFIERGCYDDDCCGLMPEQPTFRNSPACPEFEPIED